MPGRAAAHPPINISAFGDQMQMRDGHVPRPASCPTVPSSASGPACLMQCRTKQDMTLTTHNPSASSRVA